MEIINQTEEEIRKATQQKMALEDTLEQVCWSVNRRTEMRYLLVSSHFLQGVVGCFWFGCRFLCVGWGFFGVGEESCDCFSYDRTYKSL